MLSPTLSSSCKQKLRVHSHGQRSGLEVTPCAGKTAYGEARPTPEEAEPDGVSGSEPGMVGWHPEALRAAGRPRAAPGANHQSESSRREHERWAEGTAPAPATLGAGHCSHWTLWGPGLPAVTYVIQPEASVHRAALTFCRGRLFVRVERGMLRCQISSCRLAAGLTRSLTIIHKVTFCFKGYIFS